MGEGGCNNSTSVNGIGDTISIADSFSQDDVPDGQMLSMVAAGLGE